MPSDREFSQPGGRKSEFRGTEKVLIVDDEPSVLKLATLILRNNGYVVYTAGDGQQGIELYEEHGAKIDLILTDVTMPGMSGVEMIKRILYDHPFARFMFITGDPCEDLLVPDPQKKFAMLRKPFTAESLLQTIRICLDQHCT